MNAPSVLDVERALAYIPADDRDTWIKCGMGIKTEFDDEGFDVWDRWSANAGNYSARAAAIAWKSFNASGGVSIGTVFHLARQHGFQGDSNNKPTPPTPEEIAQREAKRKAEADALAGKHAEAREHVNLIRAEAVPVQSYPYLTRKGIQAHGLRLHEGRLVVPLRDVDGVLHSLQFIDAGGNKKFLPDGKIAGSFYAIGGEPSDTLLICEGMATAHSLYDATGKPVTAAMCCGNLAAVAKALRAKHPDIKIIICADDDWQKPGNPGLTKANEAAQTVGGLVATPGFNEPRQPGLKDFNDLHQAQGLEAVRICINAAKPADQQTDMLPEALPALPKVLPFDYSYLPDALRDYVRDISERMQCPPDFAGVGVMVMVAAIIGRKVGIRPMKQNDWTVTPNLWGAVVGNSGVMKSPTLAAALSPIKKLQAAAYDIFATLMADHEYQIEVAKILENLGKTEAKEKLKTNKSADVKPLLKADKTSNKPILKRYITNNASYEALGELMMENPNGLLVEADEIIGLLKQLDASGQEVARSFYLTSADGNAPYTFDRIMRGKGLHIDALCLSIIGGIQPGVLAEYVRHATGGGAGADGLLQRFGMMVYPDVSPVWTEVDRFPDSTAREAVNLLAEKLDKLNSADIGAEPDPYGGTPFLRFDDTAQRLFSEWRATLEYRLRSGEEHPAVVSHLSKYRKLIPTLALINHLCDAKQGPVSETALLRAITFGEYLESHAQRIYSYATRPDIDAAKTVLKRLASGKLPETFKARDIYQKGWAGLESPSKAQAAIDLLREYRHLKAQEITTGGRPTTEYHWVKERVL